MMIEKVSDLFKIDVTSSTPLKRNDDDDVLNLFLDSSDGEKYFLKEIQKHSMRDGLDALYFNLKKVSSDQFQLILPLSYKHAPDKFIFQAENKNLVLFKRAFLKPFDIEQYPLDKLIENLSLLHTLIKNYKFSKQEFRTYEAWLSMGVRRFRNKFDEELPFLDSFETFMNNRFPNIRFEMGNIHGDIHLDNLGLDENGKLVILDFDLVQEGCLATDLAAAASLYVDWNDPKLGNTDQIYQIAFDQVSKFANGLELSDLKYLVQRNVLGEWALLESKDDVISKLKRLI